MWLQNLPQNLLEESINFIKGILKAFVPACRHLVIGVSIHAPRTGLLSRICPTSQPLSKRRLTSLFHQKWQRRSATFPGLAQESKDWQTSVTEHTRRLNDLEKLITWVPTDFYITAQLRRPWAVSHRLLTVVPVSTLRGRGRILSYYVRSLWIFQPSSGKIASVQTTCQKPKPCVNNTRVCLRGKI